MGIGDWINIISQGADLASRVLPLVLGSDAEGASENYVLGNVAFVPFSGRIYAASNDESESGMAFALSQPNDQTTLSEFVPVPVSGAIDVTNELSAFNRGQVTLAPTDPPPSAANPAPVKIVAWTVLALGIGVTSRIIGNASVSVGKLPDGTYGIRFTNSDPMKSWVFKATVKDNQGNSASVQGSSSSVSAREDGNYEFDLSLPAGVDIDPIVAELDVTIDMPESDYQAATAEVRKRIRSFEDIGLTVRRKFARK